MKKPPSALDKKTDLNKKTGDNEAGLPNNSAIEAVPLSERIPIQALESLHLAMCRANNLSLDVGNCPSCPNPDACENEVSKIVGFIADMHEKRNKKKSVLKL